jgi:acetyl esterase/lipase
MYQSANLTLLGAYLFKNFSTITGFASPEPVPSPYDPAFGRAVFTLTALDAGFWSAMPIKTKWLRDLCEILFSGFYLFNPELARQKVNTVRKNLNIDYLRVSWNKAHSTYISYMNEKVKPKLMKYDPKRVLIARPAGSYYTEPIVAWVYFNGTQEDLKRQKKVVLDFPGGGFVSMDPRCNDERLMPWAVKLGIPIVSLDYKKAPEHPYPYGVDECFDAYRAITSSNGRCIGLNGEVVPRMCISGDSAGGNFAAATTLMIVDTNSRIKPGSKDALPVPDALMLIYPSLDLRVGNWLSREDVELMHSPSVRASAQNIINARITQFNEITHNCTTLENLPSAPKIASPPSETRMLMASNAAFGSDRVLTAEMMRVMLSLYMGPIRPPNFENDWKLSPLAAPDSLLAQMPRTYILSGERDPLTDDSILWTAKVRGAKERGKGLLVAGPDAVELHTLPGISHGFMQFITVYPEALAFVAQTSDWIARVF